MFLLLVPLALAAGHLSVAQGEVVASEVCLACHQAVLADGTHHASAVAYPRDGAGYHPPPSAAGWPDLPLLHGRVECATCHGVTGQGAALLRVGGVALCARCHLK